MKTFNESGMIFGPFDEQKVFQIEASKMFNRCNGIKPVEFIYHKSKYVLMFIEAKSSSAMDREGNEINHEKFVQEILQKFEDSFNLYMAGILKRKSGHEELSPELKNADYEKMNFKFVLVIKGHEKTWLPPLKAEFDKRMKRFRAVWNSEVIVMNDNMARECRLIS